MTKTLIPSTNYVHPLTRQVAHWASAARRLGNFDELAAPSAWQGLELYLGASIRNSLSGSFQRLQRQGEQLLQNLRDQHPSLASQLGQFQRQYTQVETTLDFFADAINTRTTPSVASLLRACDWMAAQSMARLLLPLGHQPPLVLTYLDKGLGASILKAGLRLWDRQNVNPVAVIKVVRHNLLRSTALIHETGHQVAHILGWNEELAGWLNAKLKPYGEHLAETWAGWAAEMAADAFAFVNTGYASVASLHDVLDGDRAWVFRFVPGNPHPINYLRVRLNVAMCRLAYGAGHWDELERAWCLKHPLEKAPEDVRRLIEASEPLLADIAAGCFQQPMQVFRGRSLDDWLPAAEVSWSALAQLSTHAGESFFHSSYWLRKESLRLLAYHGWLIALDPINADSYLERQRGCMLRLGQTIQ